MNTRMRARRWRALVGVVALYLAAVGFLLYRVTGDLDPRYREGAEEALVDTAQLLATLLERGAYDGVIQTDELARTVESLSHRRIDARIFDIEKHAVSLRVYVTDRDGIVLFDSEGSDLGADYSWWRDVSLTLEGRYGARTTLSDPADPRSAVMYVAAPIREQAADGSERIIGVVSVGKPMSALRPFIVNARQRLALFGALSTLAFAMLLVAAVAWLVRPFGLLRDLWRSVLLPKPRTPRALARRAALAARSAIADLRDALSGRSYVEEYVQTLAHELKSPLAAIRGAAELLREPMPDDARARFTGNVVEQAGRAQDLIDRMLELTALERRAAPDSTGPVDVDGLMHAVRDELAPIAARREVELQLDAGGVGAVAGDPFLLQRALSNLVRNAIDFAPRGSAVEVGARDTGRVEITVRDRGPGLPPFAQARVFEKFFSLARPDTGRRGTGLGLAFVREVAVLHGGAARLENQPGGGAVATLTLPRAG